MKHWKLFKEIRSRSQGELNGELTNIGGTCGMEGGYNGLQSSVTDSLSSLSKNKLSKSTLALTGFDESDYNQPLRVTSCVNSPHYNNRQYFHENFDTTSYLPKILEKRPKYSSLMNLIRHKSKKSTNNCSVQNDNRPRAITTIDHKLSSTQLDKQSNFDLTKTSMKVTTLCNNNNSYYSKGLSKSKSNARECIPTDFSLKQQQEILIKRLCQIEAQTEYLSGTLICEVIGISGSTASLSRDVFKISLKYGSPNLSSVYELQTNDEPPDIKPLFTSTIPLNQKTGFDDKWTVTGRLSSSSFSIATSALSSYSSKSPTHLQTYCLDDRDLKFPAQKWDHTKHIFNPTIGDVLTIKAVMLKRFGKPEVFIQQACDIVNLLTYKGHHISVGLKHFTDLQFHFILKWCPLADKKDDRMFIRFILNDQEISESSSKDECHRIRRLNTDSFSHKADHRYNNQHHLSNLLRTEACSSDFIVPQDDPDSSDLENKGSITILTVRSNRANPSRRYVPNKYVPKISKWISLPDLEITHEASDSEINSTRMMIIFTFLKRYSKKENRTKDRSQEGSLIDNNFVPVKIGLLQTSRPPELASKSTNGQLSDKINKLKDKVDAKRRIHGDQSGLLKDLDKALTNLITQLEKNSNQFTELLTTEQPQSYTSLSASPKKADFSGTFEENTDKQNTLKSLWESLAYLDEIEKSNTEDIEDQETSSISSSLHSLGINEDTGINNHKNDQDIRTTGWKQFDLALIWHLNYTLLLLDRVYPDHLFVNSSISVSEATDLHISQNTIDNMYILDH
ncbi:unnamed protein product [Heterobilharzia americana]|nr:unnamed protein product [Heterobilharzia americana]